MPILGKSFLDDPSGISVPTPAINKPDLGTEKNPFGTIHATVVAAQEVLNNNAFLQSENAAGTGTLNLVKANASNATVVNTLAATTGLLQVNEVTTQSWNATAFTSPKYNLTDGSDKNYNVPIAAAGTAYALTNTAAALDFGTTDPAITLNKAGTYLLLATVNLKYNAATFAASRAVTLKLRRTNNTAADLTGGSLTLDTDIITTLTYTMGVFHLPPILYTTAVLTDVITIFGDVAVVPTAGSLDAVAANITAVRLY